MQPSPTQLSDLQNTLTTVNSDPPITHGREKKAERVDIALDISAIVLTTLKDSAKISPIPYLSPAATIVLSLLQLVQRTRNNKENFKRLAEDACEVIYHIVEAHQGINEEDMAPGLAEDICRLADTLNSIEEFANKMASRKAFKALIFSSLDARKIEHYKDKLQQAERVFSIKSMISLRNAAFRTEARQERFWAGFTNYCLITLIDILRKRQQNPFNKVANRKAIEQMGSLLKKDDYADASIHITDTHDAENIVAFIFDLIDQKLLTSEDPKLTNRRARRFLIKVGARLRVIPESLYLDPEDFSLSSWPSPSCGGRFRYYKVGYRGGFVQVKRLNQYEIDKCFCREALTWRTLSHERVLPFLGIYHDPSQSFIGLVSPFMENGTLRDWRRNCKPSVAEIEKKVLEVAEGLRYLHHESIVHGDLCTINVLLDNNYQVKIANYGQAQHLDSTATATSASSFQYAAPELLSDVDDADENNKRTKKADVYAFACLYYETHFDRLPFTTNKPLVISRLVREGKRPAKLLDPPLGDKAWSVITHCWDPVPGERWSMSNVVIVMSSWSIPDNLPCTNDMKRASINLMESQSEVPS